MTILKIMNLWLEEEPLSMQKSAGSVLAEHEIKI